MKIDYDSLNRTLPRWKLWVSVWLFLILLIAYAMHMMGVPAANFLMLGILQMVGMCLTAAVLIFRKK